MDSEKIKIVAENYLSTTEGRRKIAMAMAAPLRLNRAQRYILNELASIDINFMYAFDSYFWREDGNYPKWKCDLYWPYWDELKKRGIV